MVDVAYVQVRVFGCNLVSAPPARLVLRDPFAMFRCEFGDVHGAIVARRGTKRESPQHAGYSVGNPGGMVTTTGALAGYWKSTEMDAWGYELEVCVHPLGLVGSGLGNA